MFTEEEKNEIIAHVTEKRVPGKTDFCPLTGISKGCEKCKQLFPRISLNAIHSHPCNVYSKKYVKDKFWKAME